MIGRVIKLISNLWTVDVEGRLYNCSSIGKFKYLKISPLVGDIVEIDEENKVIKKILPRKNELVRPPIANVNQAIIVTSVKEPDFSSNLLDKMLVIIEYNNIKPIICITKYDLLDDTTEIDNIIDYYKSIGYDVFINYEVDKIKDALKDKVTVLAGQTGAGKSSLLNRLNIKLNLKTNEISKALGRGKHTTRHVELLNVDNALVADTPGFSSLSFINMNKKDIKDNFIEFYKYEHNCKYQDCIHVKEDGCYIKKLVEDGKISKFRYDNYLNFIQSIEEKRW